MTGSRIIGRRAFSFALDEKMVEPGVELEFHILA